MTTPFLKQVAADLIAKHNDDLADLWIVVPGKRAGLFLRKYLAEALGKPIFAPQIFTLPDFVSKLSDKATSTKLDLLLELYSTYKNIKGDEAESFDVFSKWGTTALQDFSDIEQSLVSPNTLFKDLRDIKEIENWSFHQQELSDSQKQYLDFWNQLGPLYQEFRELQLNKGKYSYALLCNELAKATPASLLPENVKHLWFVGLSNLSKAEQRIIGKLREADKANVRWDVDDYYLLNDKHEAGSFLRHHTRTQDHVNHNGWMETPKVITSYETTTPYSQALLAGELIGKIDISKAEQTAVIIADSALLIPLIKNLPQLDCKVNIAMGYPLKQTAILRLLKSFLHLHSMNNEKAKRGIYYKIFLQFLEQESLSVYLKEETQSIRSLLASQKKIYLRPSDIHQFQMDHPLFQKLEYIFEGTNKKPGHWLKSALRLLDELYQLEIGNDFELECILRAQELLSEVIAIFSETSTGDSDADDMKSLSTMINQLLGNESITFTGEPLEGLQILNMVETRAIDFEHVIIIGANEDQLPGNLSDNSLIPYDVRYLYEMPIIADKESTYAYTLYRLLQRASKVDFLYSSITSDFKGTEQSRYITQLEIELPQYSDKHELIHIKSSLSINDVGENVMRIPNDDYAKKRVQELWESGISPSALNKFLTCPLDFYYRYILGLGEEEEVEEYISAATFGSAVHDVLENFFVEYVDSFPTKAELLQFRESLGPLLEKAFHRHYGIGDLDYGENYLQYSLALKMLEKAVDFEISQLEEREKEGRWCKIASIESFLKAEIPNGEIPFPLNIKGKADRIDDESGTIRIIDYKTGAVSDSDVKIKSDKAFENIFDGSNSKAIQLLFYSYMKSKEGIAPEHIQSALFSLKNHSSGWQHLTVDDRTYASTDDLVLFEQQLVATAKKMLALSVFEHASSSKHCEYCNR
ncbi:MAG: PD-(D/E)XK nuclease family protein [Flavobacteriales bacterium]